MRTTPIVALCVTLVLAGATTGLAASQEDAAQIVQSLGAAARAGDTKGIAALATPETGYLLAGGMAFQQFVSGKVTAPPVLLGSELRPDDAAVLRALFAGSALAGAQSITLGEPTATAQGTRVPVTVVFSTEITLTERDGKLVADLLAATPQAKEMVAQMMAREPTGDARLTTCLSNAKQLALAMLMYASDHKERLPRAATWMDDLKPYVRSQAILHCTADSHQYSYSMNSEVSGKSLATFKDPAKIIMLFESDSGKRNAAAPAAKLGKLARHGGKRVVAYVDGHAKALSPQ